MKKIIATITAILIVGCTPGLQFTAPTTHGTITKNADGSLVFTPIAIEPTK